MQNFPLAAGSKTALEMWFPLGVVALKLVKDYVANWKGKFINIDVYEQVSLN